MLWKYCSFCEICSIRLFKIRQSPSSVMHTRNYSSMTCEREMAVNGRKSAVWDQLFSSCRGRLRCSGRTDGRTDRNRSSNMQASHNSRPLFMEETNGKSPIWPGKTGEIELFTGGEPITNKLQRRTRMANRLAGEMANRNRFGSPTHRHQLIPHSVPQPLTLCSCASLGGVREQRWTTSWDVYLYE